MRGTLAGTLDLEQRDKVIAQKPLMVTPTLDQLPVYVRGGSILPIAPLTQSTAEVPNGPLTLRVFPPPPEQRVEACAGEVYTDDGHTFDFRNGEFARIHFYLYRRRGWIRPCGDRKAGRPVEALVACVPRGSSGMDAKSASRFGRR